MFLFSCKSVIYQWEKHIIDTSEKKETFFQFFNKEFIKKQSSFIFMNIYFHCIYKLLEGAFKSLSLQTLRLRMCHFNCILGDFNLACLRWQHCYLTKKLCCEVQRFLKLDIRS